MPVYPHDFVKVNTNMEVIHEAGGRTAWTDKHPAHEIVAGPSGRGLDELYAPEINSTTVQGHPDVDWTSDPTFTRTYDGFKVAGVLNQIRGLDHTGRHAVGVPTMFGMNFQSGSVAEKVTADGYVDARGTRSNQLALSLDAVDQSLDSMLDALEERRLTRSTLGSSAPTTAKSPIDVGKLHMIPSASHPNPRAILDVTDPIDLLTNAGVVVRQETADDVSLLWLDHQSQAPLAAAVLETNGSTRNDARLQTIFSGQHWRSDSVTPPTGGRPT